MTNEELIQLAASVICSRKHKDCSSGEIGCALISGDDSVFTGVCIDTMSSMGFCAEHNAIWSMVTAGEYLIKKIVAVWKNEQWEIFIVHPCGRCREFIRQIDKWNFDKTEVILGKNRVVKISELLPYNDDFSKL